MAQEDRYYDPMIYDVMRELATQVGGAYLARSDRAATPEEEQHWLQVHREHLREVRAVPAMDLDAVEAMIAKLRILRGELYGQAVDQP